MFSMRNIDYMYIYRDRYIKLCLFVLTVSNTDTFSILNALKIINIQLHILFVGNLYFKMCDVSLI